MIATIEICAGSRLKKEYSYELDTFVIDRMLPIPCPVAYGFINDTLSEDGDALDVFIVGNVAAELASGNVVNVDVLGVFLCEDHGVEDHKLVARIRGDEDSNIGQYETAIQNYLSNYKKGFHIISQEDKDMGLIVYGNAKEAWEIGL